MKMQTIFLSTVALALLLTAPAAFAATPADGLAPTPEAAAEPSADALATPACDSSDEMWEAIAPAPVETQTFPGYCGSCSQSACQGKGYRSMCITANHTWGICEPWGPICSDGGNCRCFEEIP